MWALAGYTGSDGGPCEACGPGTFKLEAGPGQCTACAEGSFSNASKASGCGTCALEEVHVGGPDEVTCVSCPPQTGAPAGGGVENCTEEGLVARVEEALQGAACSAGCYAGQTTLALPVLFSLLFHSARCVCVLFVFPSSFVLLVSRVRADFKCIARAASADVSGPCCCQGAACCRRRAGSPPPPRLPALPSISESLCGSVCRMSQGVAVRRRASVWLDVS
eukprot:1511712-Rhodomonas_salina.1